MIIETMIERNVKKALKLLCGVTASNSVDLYLCQDCHTEADRLTVSNLSKTCFR